MSSLASLSGLRKLCSSIGPSSRNSIRMLKKSASIVLASLRSSTYRSVRLASSLAAALLNGLFEHPACGSPDVLDVRTIEFPPCHNSFSAACYTRNNDGVGCSSSWILSDRLAPHGSSRKLQADRERCRIAVGRCRRSQHESIATTAEDPIILVSRGALSFRGI